MSRKLATIRRVSALRPIEGADMIELAIVDGWQCVVKKGEFAIGDLGVYFEIDSFLPSTDVRYAFLETKFIKWEGKIGARIKTMKLKGQLSQGLLLPAMAYPEIDAVEDSDVTEALGIEKWEKPLPACLGGTARGNFPSFIPKTDQERVQNIRDLFEDWGQHTFQESTKMDGSSMTVYYVAKGTDRYDQNAKPDGEGNMPDELSGVCSRNLDLVEAEGNQFWITARQNQIIEKLRALGRNLAIQGELCGSGIQSNFEKFPDGFHDFFVYDVWDIDAQAYLSPTETHALADQLGLKHVPVHGYIVLNDVGQTISQILDRAEGQGINGAKREGIVFKHVDSGFSFKAISNSYLLKHGE
ncbi:RNA ligase (TIGR02306 family) [Paraburkholderia tropica]|uniref:RNA ligase (ATP) n=1 Tax=Paraburkholderia tropica TaxID=92647 RepID=UPI00160CE1CE|nr:RNA ligase (ATP) [Paraburkholderia tropica]MBB3004394.1 RNA ligase (TIGR02306 family) [Paraburkholderia tropica]